MQSNRRWQAVFIARVLANIVVGALLMALAGALCGVIMGAIAEWIARTSAVAAGVPLQLANDSPFMATCVATGALLGTVIGALIFAIAAARAQPGRTFEPLRSLIGRVALGLITGTVGFCSLFLAVEWARGALTDQSFYSVAMNDLTWMFPGVPILMIFGAIAGALSKRP